MPGVAFYPSFIGESCRMMWWGDVNCASGLKQMLKLIDNDGDNRISEEVFVE